MLVTVGLGMGQMMLHVLDVRDAVTADQFVQVQFDAGGATASINTKSIGPSQESQQEGQAETLQGPCLFLRNTTFIGSL